MNERNSDPLPDVGDSAWAQNRWPTIGLFSGAGIGLLLGLVFVAGWLRTIAYVVALTITGCAVGLILAKLVYSRARGGKKG